MRSLMPDVVVLSALAVLAATSVMAAGNVSPAYDGTYTGQAVPAPAMSSPACNAFPLAPVTITQGSIRSGGGGAALQGFVTQDGFVTGHLDRPGKPRMVIEGRFTGGDFSGGAVDDTTACAWTVKLAPT